MFETLLVEQLFAFLLVFSRIGAGLMVLPGIGETYVPPRVRLLLALAFSVMVAGVVGPRLPAMPDSPAGLLILIVGESVIGIFLGLLCRYMIAAMHMAGQIFSYQASLSAAMMLDLNQGGQSTAIGNLLSMVAVVLLFSTNLHHLMLMGLTQSYGTFAPGVFPPVADLSTALTKVLSQSFAIAMKIAGPLIVMGLMVNLIAGVLARLMPNLQIFFLLMSPQILLSFFVLMVTFSSLMLWYIDDMEQVLGEILRL